MRRSCAFRAAIALALLGLPGPVAPTARGQEAPEVQAPADRADGTAYALPALPTVEVPRGIRRPNEQAIDASPLPRDKAPQIDFVQQTGNFTIGQQITGGTSGATGTILADVDKGTAGTLTLTDVRGEFVDGEPLTDPSGGAAVADGGLREGVWVLDFSFKPLRTRWVEIPGLGRKMVMYLYYRVINRSGKPRVFVPQFFLETDTGDRYPDKVVPQAVPVIQNRENPTLTLLGAVSITGTIPPSTRPDIDEAVYGVAVWVLDEAIMKSDTFTVYVRGLSDGVQVIEPEEGEPGEPETRYKTLRMDFARPGDEFNFRETELLLVEPGYEWIYD